MALSKSTVETLIDLVEIKLGCMEVYDRDDARELKALEVCRHELEALSQGNAIASKANGRANGVSASRI